MHQDTGTADRTPSDDDLLVYLHSFSRRRRACGVLYGRGYEAVRVRRRPVEKNPRNGRIRKNGKIRARREWIDVRGA
jgi:hypothetical protein